jgi:hypothetical protein
MPEESQAEERPQKIVKSVKKMRIEDQPSDFAYWQTQPYAARLRALEDIRRAYIAWKYDTDPGFQRVYTIIKQ